MATRMGHVHAAALVLLGVCLLAIAPVLVACGDDQVGEPTTAAPSPTSTATSAPTSPTATDAPLAQAEDCPRADPAVSRRQGLGVELVPFCIFWRGAPASPGGYRVVLRYETTGEVFLYNASAAATALRPGVKEWPQPDQKCTERHVFTVELRSLPDLRILDAVFVNADCIGPPNTPTPRGP